jgi:hypothetical protein
MTPATIPPDRLSTLDQLEGEDWGAPSWESHLVTTCHSLRHKPIGQFGTEDLRIMIRQGIGLLFLVPLALEVLDREPLAEGAYCPGDLLEAVLSIGEEFWNQHPDWYGHVQAIVGRMSQVPEHLAEAVAGYRAKSGRTRA